MSEVLDLSKMKARFHPDDLEWRIMRKPRKSDKSVAVCPYVTARAIHQRFDEVVGPANWHNTPQVVTTVGQTKGGSPIVSVQVGIAVRIGGEWVTKYNVSEPTAIEPAKGGFSGAEKRAAEEWGVGRYLWFLGEMYAEIMFTNPGNGGNWQYAEAKESENKYFDYWWQPPRLPTWALPEDTTLTQDDLNRLKIAWAAKFAKDEKSASKKLEGFRQFAHGLFGANFSSNHPDCWTVEMFQRAMKAIETNTGGGSPADVPFG